MSFWVRDLQAELLVMLPLVASVALGDSSSNRQDCQCFQSFFFFSFRAFLEVLALSECRAASAFDP